jgi:hypothetical protein
MITDQIRSTVCLIDPNPMVKHEPELHTRLGDISGTHEGDGDSSADGADLKGGAG